jgi:MFS family permease
MDFRGFFLAGLTFAGWVFGVSVLTLPALPALFGFAALATGSVAAGLYLWHARVAEHPLLDLRLFRFPLFRTSVVAGMFLRLGVGATPFLFPLMLQLSFGLSPFESGMVTFAGAVGAFAAKFAAEWVLARFGFRTTLVWATFVTVLGLFAMGLYDQFTPPAVIIGILIVTGFFQSMFWTGTNVFTFADIEDRDAGQANVISQVWVQMSLAFGVALGGGVLEGMRLLHGGEPQLFDFHVAFYLTAAMAIVSTLIFWRLPRDAGRHLSGHRLPGGGEERIANGE